MNEATKKTLTCIVCPMGCQIEVTLDHDGKVTGITGNTCKRGYDYAQNEFTNPTRTLTSTVRIKSETDKLLPVRTLRGDEGHKRDRRHGACKDRRRYKIRFHGTRR